MFLSCPFLSFLSCFLPHNQWLFIGTLNIFLFPKSRTAHSNKKKKKSFHFKNEALGEVSIGALKIKTLLSSFPEELISIRLFSYWGLDHSGRPQQSQHLETTLFPLAGCWGARLAVAAPRTIEGVTYQTWQWCLTLKETDFRDSQWGPRK